MVDENNLYTPDGKIGAGAILIQRQQVSAYSAEWIIFKGDLKDLVKDWIRNPASNKGKRLAGRRSRNIILWEDATSHFDVTCRFW